MSVGSIALHENVDTEKIIGRIRRYSWKRPSIIRYTVPVCASLGKFKSDFTVLYFFDNSFYIVM